jgi:hypothetical protein
VKKNTEIYMVRPEWLKIMLKSDILFSDTPPWLKTILKSAILFGHTGGPWLKNILKSIRSDRRG